MRLAELIEKLKEIMEKEGDIEVLKTWKVPHITRIRLRNNKFKPNDTYVLLD